MTMPWRRDGIVVLAWIALLLFSTRLQAAMLPDEGTQHQAVVLALGAQLIDGTLPAFIPIKPGRFLPAGTLRDACRSANVRRDSLVLFLPDSRRCEAVQSRSKAMLGQRLHRLTGSWQMDDPWAMLQHKAFLVLLPTPLVWRTAQTACTCPQNAAPTGTVDCTAQTRTAGEPIGVISFVANDSDSDSLAHQFSHQVNAAPAQNGLPSSLASVCSGAIGSVHCTVQGTAPASVGVLTLNLAVNDGLNYLNLDSLLEVLAPVEDRIFADGFEELGCL